MSENEKKIESDNNSDKRLKGASMGTNHFGNVAEDVDSYGKTWRKLISYCRKHLSVIVMALILILASNVLQVIAPGRLRVLTDIIQNGISGTIEMNAVITVAVTLAVIYAIVALLNFLQSFIMAGVTARISEHLRTEISRKINKLPLKFFDSVSLGDIISRVTNDVDTIGQTLNQNIGTLMASSTLFIGSLILMVWTNWILALVVVAASAVGFVSSKAVLSRSKKFFKAQQTGIGAVGGHVEEIYSGHSVMKAYNGKKAAKETFAELNRNLYTAAWKAQFVSGFVTPLMQFSGTFAYVAVCVVGAMLVMRGQITFGVIVAFLLYVSQFTQGLTHIAETFPGLQGTTAASERVFDLLDEEELSDESDKTQRLDDIKGDVGFAHVKFGYTRDKAVIHDFSAQIKSGQKIAIVGPTGAGKTTIVNLLMRFYELDGGEISIDGVPISQITRANVHDQFSMVLQDTWLFEGSVRENIMYNKVGVTEEEIVAVCQAIGLHHFITALPDGYSTILNDNASMSEGQKQLVAIARAMIHNAPMLILDEATSSVDTRTEALIQAAMDQLMTGRTSFVIAHRLSTIKNADLIFVLKDGDIIESGTHNELLGQNGFYTELYNSQFEVK
ncbi:MAG: ABC transporter ATP-binding protein/permease [Oscillospiraceae bacterium]|nr:ABC transporter ATP-binding protein/permease [Oscillospiraceae bacterium]